MDNPLDPRALLARIEKLEQTNSEQMKAIDALANAVLNNSRKLMECQEALTTVMQQLVHARAIPDMIDGKVVHDA